MIPKAAVRIVDMLLRELMGNDLPFGGLLGSSVATFGNCSQSFLARLQNRWWPKLCSSHLSGARAVFVSYPRATCAVRTPAPVFLPTKIGCSKMVGA